MKTYVLDGAGIRTMEDFYDAVERTLITPGKFWGRNGAAFNDILRGGFGTPDGGFRWIWRNVAPMRAALGYEEMVIHFERCLPSAHPTAVDSFRTALADARARRGPTFFDNLVEVVRAHGKGGAEAEDNVELVLEE